MGVNPVTGGDRALLIKEIKGRGRRAACRDSPTSISAVCLSLVGECGFWGGSACCCDSVLLWCTGQEREWGGIIFRSARGGPGDVPQLSGRGF